MTEKTVGFLKLEEPMNYREYAPRPQDDRTVTIAAGIYEVTKRDDKRTSDYYIYYKTTEGEEITHAEYSYAMEKHLKNGRYFETR